MVYSDVRKPDIVVGSENDIMGTMISRSLGTEVVPFRREYHDDGAPAPRVDMNYTLTGYEEFEGEKALTVYRRRQLPDRNSVARYLASYPRVVANLTNSDTFGMGEVDVLYPYWISGRADHNPRNDRSEAIRLRDKGRGVEYVFDASLFMAAGANRILTFHPHFHREPGVIDVGGIEVVCLDAIPHMVRYGRDVLGMTDDCLVLNPDLKPERSGKYDIALEFAKRAGLNLGEMEKARLSPEEVQTKTRIDADGRDVLIVDDIASTLGTIKGAVRNIDGASRIDVMLVHAVLPQKGHSAVNELMSSDDYPVRTVTATHTIDSDISRIPVSDSVVDFYRKGNGNFSEYETVPSIDADDI